MLNSRHRAQLRGMANTIDTIVQIGKGGISENVVTQVSDALAARELIKGRVLDSAMTPHGKPQKSSAVCALLSRSRPSLPFCPVQGEPGDAEGKADPAGKIDYYGCEMRLRLGVLRRDFNPPHMGHIRAAEAAVKRSWPSIS
jgi:RNA-binding protein YhbY